MKSGLVDLTALKAQKKIYIFEKSSAFKKLFLKIIGMKPSAFEYEICLSNPMGEELYKIFPHHKIKRRWRPAVEASLLEK